MAYYPSRQITPKRGHAVKRHTAVVATAFAVLAACSSGEGPQVAVDDSISTTTEIGSTTAAEVENSSEAAREYVELLASGNAGRMERLLELSEPGSLAHSYAIHQLAIATADRDAGLPTLSHNIDVEGNTITLIAVDPGTGEENNTVYSDFKADQDSGRLTSFSVNGLDVAPRLIVPSGQRASEGGVNMVVKSAYQTVDDVLFVTFDVENTTNGTVNINSYTSVYIDSKGRQVQAAGAGGPVEVRANATAAGYVFFPQAEVGGDFILEGFTENFADLFEITISIV